MRVLPSPHGTSNRRRIERNAPLNPRLHGSGSKPMRKYCCLPRTGGVYSDLIFQDQAHLALLALAHHGQRHLRARGLVPQALA